MVVELLSPPLQYCMRCAVCLICRVFDPVAVVAVGISAAAFFRYLQLFRCLLDLSRPCLPFFFFFFDAVAR